MDNNKTTLDLNLTNAQEDALEHAIISIFKHNSHGPGYRIREMDITRMEYNNSLHLTMVVDNGKPGTLGYIWPSWASLFIGVRGGYSCYNDKGKQTNGWRALIRCTRT